MALGANYLRPLPQPVATLHVRLPETSQVSSLSWPDGLQAAVGADGYGVLASQGAQKPLATASIAKVITALCVLQKAPLAPDQTGPIYTVTADDVALYDQAITQDGSLIRVVEGEQLTEYQALVALMLPSANNIADSLAGWVFGSQAAYQTYATDYLRTNQLSATTVGSDSSGYSESTTSTADDLTKLGILALKNPVLMAIAGQPSATLPVVGTVHNYNTVLGQNGITGLKTGNNLADAGAFLFTSQAKIGGQKLQLTGAVMGARSLEEALAASVQLAGSLPTGFEPITLGTHGQALGDYRTAWGFSAPIVAATPLQLVRWKAEPLRQTHQLQSPDTAGKLGRIALSAGGSVSRSNLRLAQPVQGPSFWWRLTRH